MLKSQVYIGHEGNYLTFIDENKKTDEAERSQQFENCQLTNIIEVRIVNS